MFCKKCYQEKFFKKLSKNPSDEEVEELFETLRELNDSPDCAELREKIDSMKPIIEDMKRGKTGLWQLVEHLHKIVTDGFYGAGFEYPELVVRTVRNRKTGETYKVLCGLTPGVFYAHNLVYPIARVLTEDIAATHDLLDGDNEKLTNFEMAEMTFEKQVANQNKKRN